MTTEATESPDVRYGRVLESAEISGYTAQRAFEGVRSLLESGDWHRVGPGFNDLSTFIRSVPFGRLNPPDDLRLEYERVAFEHGASKRSIADSAGVSEGTVRNDLRPAQDYAPDAEAGDAEHAEPAIVDAGPAQDYAPDAGLPGELDDVPLWPEDEAEPADAVPSPDEVEDVAEPVQLEPAAPGWHRLGDHLLYCGDSADQEFVAACSAAAFAFADPPYNAGKAEWDQGFEWKHDYLAESAEIVAVTPGLASLAGFLAKTEMPYRWSIAAEITNGMTAGALRFGNWICVTLFAHGSIYRKSKDHIRIPAATGDDAGGKHASRKPIRLLTSLIELFTTKGDTVVDPFLGSGTTLIASELTGRRCVGAELDPMHCAEIIQRYHQARA